MQKAKKQQAGDQPDRPISLAEHGRRNMHAAAALLVRASAPARQPAPSLQRELRKSGNRTALELGNAVKRERDITYATVVNAGMPVEQAALVVALRVASVCQAATIVPAAPGVWGRLAWEVCRLADVRANSAAWLAAFERRYVLDLAIAEARTCLRAVEAAGGNAATCAEQRGGVERAESALAAALGPVSASRSLQALEPLAAGATADPGRKVQFSSSWVDGTGKHHSAQLSHGQYRTEAGMRKNQAVANRRNAKVASVQKVVNAAGAHRTQDCQKFVGFVQAPVNGTCCGPSMAP